MGVTTRKRAAAEPSQHPISGDEAPQQGNRRRRTAAASPAPASKRQSHKPAGGAGKPTATGKKRPSTVAGKGKRKGKGKAPAASTGDGAKTASPPAASAATGQQATTSGAPSAAPITINRAPVLTLWAAVVAQREGRSWREALTFGKLVSGIMAQSKGKSLGIYEERERSEEEEEAAAEREQEQGVERVRVFGMNLRAVPVPSGERYAYSGGQPLQPGPVEGYLKRSFKGRLGDAKAAMEELAGAVPVAEMGRAAYQLYDQFRPEWKGWGVPGQLDLGRVRGLAGSWQ